jgi:hypothetical protein
VVFKTIPLFLLMLSIVVVKLIAKPMKTLLFWRRRRAITSIRIRTSTPTPLSTPEEHQNRDSTRTARWGFLSVLSCPQGLVESKNHVYYWYSNVMLWLKAAFKDIVLGGVGPGDLANQKAVN